MTTSITIRSEVRFERGQRGAKAIRTGSAKPKFVSPGRLPRVTRLLALAHRFEKLIQDGVVRDYAELAHLGHVSRARITQIMNLLNLAPDIQEEILFLPPRETGKDLMTERNLRAMVAPLDWAQQREMWNGLKSRTSALSILAMLRSANPAAE